MPTQSSTGISSTVEDASGWRIWRHWSSAAMESAFSETEPSLRKRYDVGNSTRIVPLTGNGAVALGHTISPSMGTYSRMVKRSR